VGTQGTPRRLGLVDAKGVEGETVTHQWSLHWGRGERNNCPTWADIATSLEGVKDKVGSVMLRLAYASEIGPQVLQVFSDRGNYLLMLEELDENDSNVRVFRNSSAAPEKIDILGNLWSATMICSDFDIVRRAFKEFFDTGDVSREVLD
jgi:hypothetical protein